MSHFWSKYDLIGPHFKTVLFLLGAFVQVIGHLIYIRNIFDDPIYGFLATAIGYLLILIISLERLLRRIEIKSEVIVLPEGEPMKKRQYLYSLKHRVATFVVLLVATGAFILISFNLLIGESTGRVAEAPSLVQEEYQEEYKERKGAFSMVDVFQVHWTGGGAYAIVGEDRIYPLAYIINPASDDVSVFLGTACALAFDLQARERLPWVRIDEIRIVVLSYRPLPEYKPMLPLPFQEAHVYYVEIDDPRVSRSNVFRARYYFERGKKQKIGTLRLEKGKPETIVLRINAKTPGIYTFACELLLSYKDTKEKITIVKSAEFLFDDRAH